MEQFDRKGHWENIYQTKALHEVSWFEPTPKTSLEFIEELKIPITAKIIDVGGGDSFLVDYLLNLGYQDITVLDISESAINRAKERLGERAKDVKWMIEDVASFVPTEEYDFWHDRAAFHFLTETEEVEHYLAAAKRGVKPNGKMLLGTFSEKGPRKCSGITIKQYDEESMTNLFSSDFEKLNCVHVEHPTPFNTTQNFIFGCFKRKV